MRKGPTEGLSLICQCIGLVCLLILFSPWIAYEEKEGAK